MKKEIKYKIYLQNEKTGEIFSVIFDYAQIFSGYAKLQLSAYFDPCKVIGTSEFTGLRINNEHEIFTDDILKYSKHDGYLLPDHIITVCFDSENACFGYTTNFIIPFLDRTSIHHFTRHDELQNDFLSHCEKIGNIYQNPELVN